MESITKDNKGIAVDKEKKVLLVSGNPKDINKVLELLKIKYEYLSDIFIHDN